MIRYALEDKLAVVTLDDGKVNAMALPFFEECGAALDRAERDEASTVVIAGRPGFYSAGLNLKVLPTLPPEDFRRTLVALGNFMLRVFTFPIPTVAAVSGHAIAGGAMLAFACDLRVMADGPFRLHLNEVAIGLILPTWAIVLAESAIPPRWRTEAILHARAYSPEGALEHAIIHRVAPPEHLLDEARALAAPLLALDHRAYAGSKMRQRAMVVEWARGRLETEAAGRPK